MKIKPKRKCKVCKTEFTRFLTTQNTCSPKCRLILKKTKPNLIKIKKETRTQLDKRLLREWATLNKQSAGYKCEYCGTDKYLNSHHIFSKSRYSVRYDQDNACCLCAGHHTMSSVFSAHKTPAEFIEWIKEKRGEEWYERLRAKAKS